MADKTKTIKSASDRELDELIRRLRKERDLQELIRSLKYNSRKIDKFNTDPNDLQVSTEEPIESLYHNEDEKDTSLQHYGVLGMKWGVRRYQNKDGTLTSAGRKRYQATSSDSAITKKVKKDLVSLSGSEFRKKYGTSTTTYMKRVDKYGDPYMNAPLAKIGKFLEKQAQNNANRYMKKAQDRANKKTNPTKGMSDAELRSRINRLQMEKQYKQLTAKEKSKGQKLVGDILTNAAKQTATNYISKAMTKGIDEIIKNLSKAG